MNTNTVLGGIVVLAILGGAAYYYVENKQAVGTPVGGEAAMGDRRAMPDVEWDFKDNGYDESKFANTTTVTLTVDGTSHDVGTYLGSCSELSESERPEGAIAASLCWFAGVGDEIGLYINETDQLVVQKREIGEPTAESPEFRGSLETVIRL